MNKSDIQFSESDRTSNNNICRENDDDDDDDHVEVITED